MNRLAYCTTNKPNLNKSDEPKIKLITMNNYRKIYDKTFSCKLRNNELSIKCIIN